ncbi:hypothetical protein GCM10009733_020620 [Nonomuraea maheshkhaliensis]|uniref:Lipoprotein n=1 Tax=Nonomuraea maheshkhaliensis TaxID=419590 RepID=A0ABN2EZH0_9ACTN
MKKILKAITAGAVALVLLTGCTGATEDQKQKRENFEAAQAAVPFPEDVVAKNPTERINVREKLIRDSDPKRLSYIYLLSMDGKVVAHFVAKGKVSSADSQLLPDYEYRDLCGSSACWQLVNAAGDDATYGNREPGIFFFTPEGMLVTWSGDYLQFDRPMKINTPISLVANVA